jgi:hypothetical protein
MKRHQAQQSEWNSMRNLDYVFLSIIYTPICPILLMLIGWWTSIRLVPESQVFIFALAGLVLGIVLDILFLKRVLVYGYRLKRGILALIYVFYTIGIFGIFMGVPVFNILPGMLAAIYVARRATICGLDKVSTRRSLDYAAWFAVAVLFAICIASAFLALNDPYTGSGISGMLGLSFEISAGMLWGIILVGGTLLLGFQYWSMWVIGIKVAGTH